METFASKSCSTPHLIPDPKDIIYQNLQKSKAILTCVMFANESLCKDASLGNTTIYHALWAVDGYLEEIESMFDQL